MESYLQVLEANCSASGGECAGLRLGRQTCSRPERHVHPELVIGIQSVQKTASQWPGTRRAEPVNGVAIGPTAAMSTSINDGPCCWSASFNTGPISAA